MADLEHAYRELVQENSVLRMMLKDIADRVDLELGRCRVDDRAAWLSLHDMSSDVSVDTLLRAVKYAVGYGE